KELAVKVGAIARQAGAAIMEIYDNEADFGVEIKGDDSPLTKADKAANTVICAGLEQLEPVFPIVSEENAAIPYEERRTFTYNWLVDPLDGTKEFIKRNGDFTVNIALVHEGCVVLGVVYIPAIDGLYWAVKGGGAFRESEDGLVALQAASFSRQDEGLKVVCSRSHLNEATQAFIDALNKPDKVARGSALKFLILAEGAAHYYPRLGPTMEWDTAAAQIVLEEAGGTVTLEDGESPLLYNKENLLNPFFIAKGREGESFG
ncbi:MAG: 3'(2'),5'-bisphosphate nucleotidase CysQ, partial [Bacteroidota bacterium]